MRTITEILQPAYFDWTRMYILIMYIDIIINRLENYVHD